MITSSHRALSPRHRVIAPRALCPSPLQTSSGHTGLDSPTIRLSLNSAITWLTITPSGMVTDRYRFRWRSLPGFDHSSRLGKPELIDRGELHPADLRVAVATADPRTHRARSAAQPILPVTQLPLLATTHRSRLRIVNAKLRQSSSRSSLRVRSM